MNEIAPISSTSKAVTLIEDRFARSDLQSWHTDVNTNRVWILRKALFVFIAIFIFGGIWASTAPLGGAIAVNGRVIAEFGNRPVQHLEGGILKSVLVREGDKVIKGQILATLDGAQYQGRLQESRLEKALLRIQLARARANAREATSVRFPTDIHSDVAGNARVLEAIQSQKDQFEADLSFRLAEEKNFAAQASGQRGQIVSLRAQLAALETSLNLYRVELPDLQRLLADGKTDRDRVFRTERGMAEVEASVAGVQVEIESRKENLGTLENQKSQARFAFLSESNALVIQLQTQLSRIEGQVGGLADIIRRLVIRSPENGTIFRVPNYTLGAVFQRGDGLFEIFPDDDALTIEGYLDVQYAEKVHLGQEVDVVFPSNRDKSVDGYSATLIYISPDSVVTEARPEGGYVVRVKLENPDDVKDLYPGNLVQVYIKTKTKTFFEILGGPLKRFGLNVFNE